MDQYPLACLQLQPVEQTLPCSQSRERYRSRLRITQPPMLRSDPLRPRHTVLRQRAIHVPVVHADSSDARKTTAFAISLGAPNRPAGTWFWMEAAVAFRSASDNPSLLYKGVEIGPGLTAFTRMPREISSPERVRANDNSAAFDA